MEILKAIQYFPGYINWVRAGRPEPEIPLSIKKPTIQAVEPPSIQDLAAVQEVKSAISNLLDNGARTSWAYDLDRGITELGDPLVWSKTMPSWIEVFPELNGTTLTDVSVQSPEYAPGELVHILMMDFRTLTTEWKVYSHFSELESKISITKTEAGKEDGKVYQGEEVRKLTLIKEAWLMAAKLRTEVRNST